MLTGQYPVCHIQTVKGTLVVVCCSFNMSRQYLNISSERFPFYINIKMHVSSGDGIQTSSAVLFRGRPAAGQHAQINEWRLLVFSAWFNIDIFFLDFINGKLRSITVSSSATTLAVLHFSLCGCSFPDTLIHESCCVFRWSTCDPPCNDACFH